MQVSDLFIRRPVFSVVVSLLLMVGGLSCLQQLAVREYPQVDPPIVSVNTTYKGAANEVIESRVTELIEGSVAGLEGIRQISSFSQNERSAVTIEFWVGRDPDAAAADVRDRVARSMARLPEGIDLPVVRKVDSNAAAIMWIGVTSSTLVALELTEFLKRVYVDRLATVPGVATVYIGGERRYAMRVWVDRTALAARGLTVLDVENAIKKQNVELPGGLIASSKRELTVKADSRLAGPEEFAKVVVSNKNGYLVRLGEVAKVEVGPEDDRFEFYKDGNIALGLGIVRQATANTLTVADGVRAELEKLKGALPPGTETYVMYDESSFIRASINGVLKTLVEGIGLVILVILVFLRDWRSTIVAMVAIPVSVIASFMVVAFFGASINVLTLLAIVLAIGIVVDDAIVEIENIHRRIEHGEPPLLASFDGAREIGFAVIATTCTLMAVFVPLAFMTGNTGRLFREFAIQLAAAIFFSGVVARTLTPMMCSKLMVPAHGPIHRLTEPVFEGMINGYRWILSRALNIPLVILAIGAVVSFAAVNLFQAIPKEFAPIEDRGYVLIPVQAPEGSSSDYTRERVKELGQRGFQQQIQFVIGGPDYQTLRDWRDRMLGKAQASGLFVNLDSDYKENQPDLRVQIDRARAADLGINIEDIGKTLELMFGEKQVSSFASKGEEYYVIVRARAQDRAAPNDLSNVFVRSAGGDLVPLSSFVTLKESAAPQKLNRFDRLRAITIQGSLTPGVSIGQGLETLEEIARAELPPEVRIGYQGQSKEFKDASSAIYVTFGLALIVVFLVLAGQFESWINPLIVMLTVPLAVTGGLLALWLTGQSLNIYSQIGMILLIGLMTKNGILIVEFANQLRERGLKTRDAVIQSSVQRLRPILMTSIATMGGALPLAWSTGAGAEARNAIGWVIVGGVSLSTLLTTLVVPSLYVLIGGYTRPANYTADLLDRMREGEEAKAAERPPHPAE